MCLLTFVWVRLRVIGMKWRFYWGRGSSDPLILTVILVILHRIIAPDLPLIPGQVDSNVPSDFCVGKMKS
jgi:hypothetical protein